MGGSGVTVDGIWKRFGPVVAVRGIELDIREGEFLTLLGPSGCGKTTTLRVIAGFEEPDEGRILLRGEDVSEVPPNRRNVNMAFQHYALFPHMTVGQNIGFGLKLKGFSKSERKERVAEILSVVRLEGMEGRRPSQLSGGQQQRVAIARALVNEPAALLLDEPLGALDVKLRKEMQLELKRIQHELRTTFVYVTHDQEEALSMSDRVAVMNEGSIEQVGEPREVYEHPASQFVADFVGVLNAIEVNVDSVQDGKAVTRWSETEEILVPEELFPRDAMVREGSRLVIAVRPELLRLDVEGSPLDPRRSRVNGVVREIVYLGSLTQFHVETSSGARLVVNRLSERDSAGFPRGRRAIVSWDPTQSTVIPDVDVPGEEAGR